MSAFFEGRTVIRAEELGGPRVYSTDLLPSLFDPNYVEESVSNAARAIKIKIITKGLVTLNSAYLLSPLAVHLFDACPDFLAGSAILPAFRVDKNSLEDLITSVEGLETAGIDDVRLHEHIARLNQSAKQVMPWDLGNVGEQYKRLALAGLRAPSSAIVHALLSTAGKSVADIEKIARDIEALDFRDSIHLRNYISEIPEPARSLMSRFATACYHMNGTGVVKCETGTDLSPLSEFKAADIILAARDAKPEILSDEAVFLEAFMGFALGKIHASILPSHIIDALDFETVHQLGAALRTSGFQEKYDGIVRQYLTSSGLSDAREALDSLDAQAVADVVKGLAGEFHHTVLAELPDYDPRIGIEAKERLYRAGGDIAHDVVAAVPAVGAFVSTVDAINDATEIAAAAAELMSVRNQNKAFVVARDKRAEKIRKAISSLDVSDKKKSSLLDAVALLSDVHGISVARA